MKPKTTPADWHVGQPVILVDTVTRARTRTSGVVTKVGRTLVTVLENGRRVETMYRMDSLINSGSFQYSRITTEAMEAEREKRDRLNTVVRKKTGANSHWLSHLSIDKLERIVAILEEENE